MVSTMKYDKWHSMIAIYVQQCSRLNIDICPIIPFSESYRSSMRDERVCSPTTDSTWLRCCFLTVVVYSNFFFFQIVHAHFNILVYPTPRERPIEASMAATCVGCLQLAKLLRLIESETRLLLCTFLRCGFESMQGGARSPSASAIHAKSASGWRHIVANNKKTCVLVWFHATA